MSRLSDYLDWELSLILATLVVGSVYILAAFNVL